MKKNLSNLIIIFSLFFVFGGVGAGKVNAQSATDSADASGSASASDSASSTVSGDLELPDTLPETGSYDVLFFVATGLVLIGAGFSGLVSRKEILEELE